MAGVFTNPQSPFETLHNLMVMQEKIASGELIPFDNGNGGLFYSSPEIAPELIVNGLEQLTLEQVKDRHKAIMNNRWGQ